MRQGVQQGAAVQEIVGGGRALAVTNLNNLLPQLEASEDAASLDLWAGVGL